MNKNQDSLTIGGLAKAAGIGVETIRYYQRRALLPEPGKPLGGIRRYGSADVQRIVFIKSAQRLGFSLDEVADLLTLADSRHCDEVRTLAEHKLEDVQQRIAELHRMEMALQELIGRCQNNQNDASCPLIQALQGQRH